MKTIRTIYKLPIYAAALLLAFLPLSCSEESQNPEISYSLPESLKSQIKQENGLVVFESQEQFQAISSVLLEESERYLLDYVSSLGEGLTDDEIHDLMIENNFNLNLVFETFEDYHGLTSLRSVLQAREEDWMDSEELVGGSPFDYPVSDQTQPFANTDGEYMIGSTIMRVEESGLAFEIQNRDFEALEMVRVGNFDLDQHMTSGARLLNNVIVHNPEALYETEESAKIQSDCKIFARANGSQTTSGGTYKMYWIMDSDWEGLYSVTKSKVYVKKRKWRRWWTYGTGLYTKVEVQYFDVNCDKKDIYGSNTTNRSYATYATAKVTRFDGAHRVKGDGTFRAGFDSDRHPRIIRIYGVH